MTPGHEKRESASLEALKILALLAVCAVLVALAKELGEWWLR